MRRILATLALVCLAAFAVAQSDPESENGFLISLLEDQLSNETRQIRVTGVSGLLSSAATVQSITISDGEGVWLEITDAVINWNRTALLGGRVEVNTLAARRIDIPRGPVADATAPSPEATGFSLPSLPVSISLDALDVEQVVLGEPLFGLAAELAVKGSLEFNEERLVSTLTTTRLDGPGGSLDFALDYQAEAETLALSLNLSEPQNGVLATLLSIPGKPSVLLNLEGDGPVADFDMDLTLAADDTPLVKGDLALRQADAKRRFYTRLTGNLAPLVPAQFAGFFAGETVLAGNGELDPSRGFALDHFELTGAALDLEGMLETGSDGFLRALELAGQVGDPNGPLTTLPFGSGDNSVGSVDLDIAFGGGETWSGRFDMAGLRVGDIDVETSVVEFGGVSKDLNLPQSRELSLTLKGEASGLSAEDPDIARALGDSITVSADARWRAGEPITLSNFETRGNGLSVSASGVFQDYRFDGRAGVDADDIAVFSGVLDRALSGQLALDLNGAVRPLIGGFDLRLNGTATDVRIDHPQIDPLLVGETRLTGGVARDEDGFRTSFLRLANEQMTFQSDGLYSTKRTRLGFSATLADIGLITDAGSGKLTLGGRADGDEISRALKLKLAMAEGVLQNRTLRSGTLRFDGVLDALGLLSGEIAADGKLDGSDIDLGGDLTLSSQIRALRNLDFSITETAVKGGITQGADGLLTGNLEIASTDISDAAALALTEASGRISASVFLTRKDDGQALQMSADIAELQVPGIELGGADLEMEITDLFGLPLADGTFEASRLTISGFEISQISGSARRVEQSMAFETRASLPIGTEARLAGSLNAQPQGWQVQLTDLTLRQNDRIALLEAPTRLQVDGSDLILSPAVMRLDEGRLRAQGSITDTIDISLSLSDIPLDIADSIQPDLGLDGTVNGQARVTGPRETPDASFGLNVGGLTSTYLRNSGIPLLAVEAGGETVGERLNLTAGVSAQNGLSGELEGSVPLSQAAGDIALGVTLGAFPLEMLNRLLGNPGIGGQVSGRADVAGSFANPEASFDLNAANVRATVMRDNGIAPLSASLQGRFADNVISLSDAVLRNPDGLALNGRGVVPLQGVGLDLSAGGSVPLRLANVALADRSAQVQGIVRLDARVQGSLSSPDYRGMATLENGVFVDPLTNLRLERMAFRAVLSTDRLLLESASARFSGGGSLQADGSIGLTAGSRFPVDMGLRVRNAKYTDGQFVSTTIDAALTLKGRLRGQAAIEGDVTLGPTEIVVPDGFGISEGALLDVVHRDAPPDVRFTLDRAGLSGPSSVEEPAAPSQIRLNVRLSAPNQIFVRGRGLDTELGGNLLITGPLDDIQPVGAFEMRRGRLSILGQRISFDSGRVTLLGTLDPQLDFQASIDTDDVVVSVSVTGAASDPIITFSSNPPLPQDETLARLIFNRSLEELSPFQLVQLAAAVATLTGRQGDGLLGQLRQNIGLDNLDVVSDDDGNFAVSAGKYVEDNIYVDLESDSRGDTRATINLDVTDDLTVRGTLGSDGETSFGIFFERDY